MAEPTTVWNRVIGSWRRRRNASQTIENAPPVRIPTRAPAAPVESFAAALQRMIDDDPSLQARLHMVSLAEFREAVGDKWGRLAGKVDLIADNLIRRHIGRGNMWERQGEDSYLLAFPRVDEIEARRRVLLIVADLDRHLMGERIAGRQARSLAREVPVGDAIGEDGQINPAAIQVAAEAAIARGRQPGHHAPRRHMLPSAGDPSATHGKQDLRRHILSSSDLHAHTAHRTIMAKVAEDEPDEHPEWQHFTFRGEAEASEDPWNTVPQLSPDSRLTLVWRPTWVSEGEAISAYTARVVRREPGQERALEGTMAYPDDDPRSAQAIDRYVVATAVRDLTTKGADRRCSVIVPISWNSLVSKQRRDIIVPFADLDAETRAQRLKVEIFRTPDQADAEQLDDVIGFIRGLGCEPLVRMRVASNILRWAAANGTAVGLDLSELRPHEKLDDAGLLAALDNLRDQACQGGIDCYLWSARRKRVIGGAVQSGFRMVNGPGLMADLRRLATVMPAPRVRFATAD